MKRLFSDPVRAAVTLAVIGIVVFLGLGIYQAGLDTPPLPAQPPTSLKKGNAEGRRLNGKSWSFDYDTVRTTPDGNIADIDNVRHGVMYRNGKPYLTITAKHVTVNTQSNDFNASGPLKIATVDTGHVRTFTTDAATYTNFNQMLLLPHPCIVNTDGAKLSIGKMSIDFKTGAAKLGATYGSFNK